VKNDVSRREIAGGVVRTSNHDRSRDRRDAWVGPSFLIRKTITSEPWVGKQTLQRERNGALSRVHAVVCSNIA
jgi:hypothetical protein